MKYINKSDSNVWVFLHQQFEVQAGKIAIFKITNDVSGDAIIFSPTSQTDFTNYSKFFFTEDVIANQDLPNGIIYVNKALYWSLEVYENTVYTTNLVNLQLLHSERVYVEPFAEECDCITTPITVGSLNISDDPYDKDAWNGVTDIAPSKNAVRDVIETLTGAVGGSATWGTITGTLSNQTDLQTALNNKVNTEAGKGLSTNDLTNALKSNYDNAYSHISLTNNPHSVTKTQVGLGNVPDLDTSNPANIIQSASYRFVSDTEKSTWNGKNEQILQAQLNTNSTTTGSTNETVTGNYAITGSVNTANSKLEIHSQLIRSGTNAAATHRFYISSVGTNTIGTTGVPASSTLIGTYSHPATSLVSAFERRMTNKNSLSLNEVFPATVSSLTDRATSTSAYTAVNFNTANNYWIVHTVQLTNSADVVGSNNTQINIIK